MMPNFNAPAFIEQPTLDSTPAASGVKSSLSAQEVFRRNLVILMRRNGLTQTKLAKMTGTFQTQLSNVVNGRFSVRIDTAEKLAVALGVSLSSMFIAPSISDYESLVSTKAASA